MIEPGKWGWALAKAVIKMEKVGDKWEVAEVTTENIETKPVDPDPEISEKFKFVHNQSIANANVVVGKITE
ncbi:unnamed protein product, partial [marine sediment metagenome]